jgi:hypothetical protein
MINNHGLMGIDDFHIEVTARAMADLRWAPHHPIAALAFAWRHRDRGGFVRSLRAIWRPRFAG